MLAKFGKINYGTAKVVVHVPKFRDVINERLLRLLRLRLTISNDHKHETLKYLLHKFSIQLT